MGLKKDSLVFNDKLRVCWRLFRKDLVIEARRGELLAMIVIATIGLSVILSYGAWLAGLSENQRILLAPALSLSVLLITALSVIGKFSEYDEQSGALEGLLMADVPSEALYLSRVAAIWVITFVAALVASLILPTLLGLPQVAALFTVSGIACVAGISLGLASTGALLASVTARVRVGGIFLLTLVLPLIIPLFFAGCEVLSGQESGHDFWWTVIWGLDAIYLAAGLWLHPYVLVNRTALPL